MSELTLSQSGISTYLSCGYRYFLSHVVRLPSAPALAPLVGTAVHAGVEAHYKGEDAAAALLAAFAAEYEQVPEAERSVDPKALDDARVMLATYLREAVLQDPRYVEATFAFRLDDVILTGIIDLAKAGVHDTKTRAGKTINGRPPKPFDPSRHQLQMTLYFLGFRSLAGIAPTHLVLDVLSRTGKFKQYPVEPDFAGLRAAVSLTAHGIMRGEFAPTGALAGTCYWCPYSQVCRHSIAAEAIPEGEE